MAFDSNLLSCLKAAASTRKILGCPARVQWRQENPVSMKLIVVVLLFLLKVIVPYNLLPASNETYINAFRIT